MMIKKRIRACSSRAKASAFLATARPAIVRWALIALACVALLGVGCNSKPAPQESSIKKPSPKSLQEYFCKGNETATEVRDPEVKYPDVSGLNPQSYIMSEHEPIRKRLADLNLHNLDEWREQAKELRRQAALSKLAAFVNSNPDRWYSNEALKIRIADPAAIEQLLKTSSPLSGIVRLTDQSASVNCVTGDYVYTVQFAIPIRPLDAVPDIQKLFKSAGIPRFRERLEPLTRGQPVYIDIPGDVKRLAAEIGHQSEFKELVERHKETIKLLDQPTQTLLTWLGGGAAEVASFNSAQFELSGDMTAVIDLLVQAFLEVRQPGKEYEITSFGVADSRPLKVALNYNGGADLRLGPGQAAEFHGAQGERTMAGSNLQLSIARGYAGAEAFYNFFQRDTKVPTGTKIRYGGKGEVPGAPLAANRRIEMVLRPNNRRPLE